MSAIFRKRQQAQAPSTVVQIQAFRTKAKALIFKGFPGAKFRCKSP
jgi:hypothetical protein